MCKLTFSKNIIIPKTFRKQLKCNLVYMLALRCRCVKHIFNSGGMFVAMVTTYAQNCGVKHLAHNVGLISLPSFPQIL